MDLITISYTSSFEAEGEKIHSASFFDTSLVDSIVNYSQIQDEVEQIYNNVNEVNLGVSDVYVLDLKRDIYLFAEDNKIKFSNSPNKRYYKFEGNKNRSGVFFSGFTFANRKYFAKKKYIKSNSILLDEKYRLLSVPTLFHELGHRDFHQDTKSTDKNELISEILAYNSQKKLSEEYFNHKQEPHLAEFVWNRSKDTDEFHSRAIYFVDRIKDDMSPLEFTKKILKLAAEGKDISPCFEDLTLEDITELDEQSF